MKDEVTIEDMEVYLQTAHPDEEIDLACNHE